MRSRREVNRRFRSGLTFNASYTLLDQKSTAADTGNSSLGGTAYNQFQPESDYGEDAFTSRHRFLALRHLGRADRPRAQVRLEHAARGRLRGRRLAAFLAGVHQVGNAVHAALAVRQLRAGGARATSRRARSTRPADSTAPASGRWSPAIRNVRERRPHLGSRGASACRRSAPTCSTIPTVAKRNMLFGPGHLRPEHGRAQGVPVRRAGPRRSSAPTSTTF